MITVMFSDKQIKQYQMVSYNMHTQPGTLVHARLYTHTRTHASHLRALTCTHAHATHTQHARTRVHTAHTKTCVHTAHTRMTRPIAVRGEFATLLTFKIVVLQ